MEVFQYFCGNRYCVRCGCTCLNIPKPVGEEGPKFGASPGYVTICVSQNDNNKTKMEKQSRNKEERKRVRRDGVRGVGKE